MTARANAAAALRSEGRARRSGPASTVAWLGFVEAKRLLRHPVVLAGAALSALLFVQDLGEYGGRFFLLTMGGVMPLAAATLLAANLATLRSRRSDTDELWASVPAPAATRTLAHVLSLLAPLALATVVLATAYAWYGAGDGLRVDVTGTTAVPGMTELAQGPLVLLALGALGIALARWLPAVGVAPVVVVAFLAVEMPVTSWGTASEWRWLAPVVNHGRDGWAPCSLEAHLAWGCDGAAAFDVTAMRWHLLYLTGLTTLFVALALLRHGRRARYLALGAGGLALTVVAGIFQIP